MRVAALFPVVSLLFVAVPAVEAQQVYQGTIQGYDLSYPDSNGSPPASPSLSYPIMDTSDGTLNATLKVTPSGLPLATLDSTGQFWNLSGVGPFGPERHPNGLFPNTHQPGGHQRPSPHLRHEGHLHGYPGRGFGSQSAGDPQPALSSFPVSLPRAAQNRARLFAITYRAATVKGAVAGSGFPQAGQAPHCLRSRRDPGRYMLVGAKRCSRNLVEVNVCVSGFEL